MPAYGQDASSPSVLGLEEVVVTARKREERLQDVPVAVSFVSAETIERAAIEDSTDLLGRVPNLYFSQNNTIGPNQDATFLVIRGVGSNPVLEPSAGLFVDGVYQSGAGFDIGFLDLERVEVLRGPQGTLFGRNTEAGAVNLVTRKPGSEFHAKALAEFDDQTSYRARLSADGPVSDSLSLGFAGGWQTTDGYLRNVTLNQDQMQSTTSAVRLALRWMPSDRTELNVSLDGSQTKGGIQGAGVRVSDGEQYIVHDDIVRDEDRNNIGVAVNFRHDFDAVTFASITGWRRTRTDAGFDVDGAASPMGNIQNIDIDQYTLGQELRLQSNDTDSRLDWLAGVYAFKEGNDFFFTIDYPDSTGWNPADQFIGGVRGIINTEPERTGWAAFTQGTYHLTDRLELTAGVRYSDETTEFKVYNFLNLPRINLTLERQAVPPGGDFKDDDVSPSLSLAMKWTSDFMMYLSAAKGFKAGGFNRAMSSGERVTPFASESARNYEVGFKSTVLNRRLMLNAALYQVDITDQQLLAVVLLPGDPVPQTRIFNVGESRSRGAELELTAQPIEALRLTASWGYTDAEFRKYIDQRGVDRAGDTTPYVPKTTASASMEWRRPAWAAYDWSLYLAGRHVSSYLSGNGTEVEPSFTIPAYTIVDAEVALHAEDRWKFAIFARNALDEFAATTTIQGFFLPRNSSTQYNKVLAPRTLGASFTYRW